jgi:hypothetical protein
LPEPVSGAGGELAFDAGEPADAGIPVSDAGADAGFDASTATCSGPPGLYADDACQLLGSGVQPYRPRYELWNDGATKERFIYLPSGAQIDTSNPDRWSFPLGTRIYKTFALDGVRLETRMLEKTGQAPGIDSWTLISYAWSADQRSVSPADAAGSSNVLGTSHDIPSQAQCRTCHNMPSGDAANGFGAIQLNHDDAGLTLRRLLDENWLVNGTPGAAPNVSLDSARIPGDATAQAALGYLHGNCGHCHGGPSPRANMRLWSTVGVSQLSAAPIFQTAVCQCLQRWTGRQNAAGDPYALRVAPGHAVISGVVGRMSARTAGEQMPPLGTEMVDPSGLAAVRAWIDSLDPSACDGAPPTCGTP